MKKLLSSLFVLLLLVSCCLIAAFPTSATDINYEDFFIEDGVLIEYVGAGGDVVIPSVDADGNPITHIDTRAFHKNTDITSVVISEGIETMGGEVFEYCENLTEASLPYSLTETGISVFRKTSLYSLVIPGQLKLIKSDFAVAAQTLSEVVISSGVERLVTGSLYGCFTELVLPESVWRVDAIFRGGMSVAVKRWELYVLNPDCELGIVDPKDSARTLDLFSGAQAVKPQLISETQCPITFGYKGCKCEIVIYGLKDSPIKEYVNTYMKDKMGTVTARFSGLDQDKIDELEKKNEERSITKPTVDPDANEDPNSTGNGNTSGGTTDNGNNNNAAGNSANDSTMLIVIIAVAGGFFLLIIVVVVVLIVVMNNKKKKKKKKKAKKAVEAVLEEVVEAVTEEVTEENGDEE